MGLLRAPSGFRTHTEPILSRLPLPLGYGGVLLRAVASDQILLLDTIHIKREFCGAGSDQCRTIDE